MRHGAQSAISCRFRLQASMGRPLGAHRLGYPNIVAFENAYKTISQADVRIENFERRGLVPPVDGLQYSRGRAGMRRHLRSWYRQ